MFFLLLCMEFHQVCVYETRIIFPTFEMCDQFMWEHVAENPRITYAECRHETELHKPFEWE